MPELGHLRTFIAVAEEHSFTRADERLHLAQQAVSKSVATLESQLGVALLIRTTREVSLTPAGEALLITGRTALSGIDAAFAQATAVGHGLSGTLRVGVTPAVGTAAHPNIAAALTADAPSLHVTFRDVRPPEAAALLRRHELDLVLSRVGPTSDEFGHAALTPSTAIAVVAPGHRLASRTEIGAGDLDGETLATWSPPGDAYTDGVVELALAAPGLELPLWVHWTLGASLPAVDRLRRHLASH